LWSCNLVVLPAWVATEIMGTVVGHARLAATVGSSVFIATLAILSGAIVLIARRDPIAEREDRPPQGNRDIIRVADEGCRRRVG
jgi:hypothetical protein